MKLKHLYIILFSFCILCANNSNALDNPDTIDCTDCYYPVAIAGEDQTYYKGSTVILDGSLSYDPEGSDLTYIWSSSDGITLINSDTATPSFIASPGDDVLGTCSDGIWLNLTDCEAHGEIWDYDYLLSFTLIVNDGVLNSSEDSIIITVVNDNTPPELTIEENYVVNKLSEFTLDASNADDSNSLTGILTFDWDYDFDFELIEGSNDASIITLKAPDAEGNNANYDIILTIDDGEDPLIITLSIVVLSNVPPFSIFGEDISVPINTDFTLLGGESFDPDNVALTYLWDYSDCEAHGYTLTTGSTTTEDITLESAGVGNISCSVSLVVNDGVYDSKEWSGE